MNFIVDSHCHLDLIEEKGIKFDEIIDNCQKNNVAILQNISTRLSTIDKILSYTKNNDFIFASAGIHPCYVQEEKEFEIEELQKICNNPKVIGVGETGLDFYYSKEFKQRQIESFEKHIKVSQQNNLPLIIHNRDSDETMIELLTKHKKIKDFPALLHCFCGSKELALKSLDLGVYISISGIVTFKNATDLQDIVKNIPLEYLLVETDSPYLAPTPYRGKINQPSLITHTVDFIANLKNVSRETIIQQTTNNFFKLFNKAKLPN